MADNAFLKGFIVRAYPRLTPRQWREYVSNYKGNEEFDYDVLDRVLEDVGKIQSIGEDNCDTAFAAEIRSTLEEYARRPLVTLDGKELRRFEWDGRLVSLLAARFRQERSAAIVSSSSRLREVCEPHFARVGFSPILSPSAVAFILSLAPGVTMGLQSLRNILFDNRFVQHLPPIHQLQPMLRAHVTSQHSLRTVSALEATLDRALPRSQQM